MVKKTLMLSTSLFLLSGLSYAKEGKVVAMVNGVKINQNEVIKRMEKRYYAATLNEIINETVILNEAKKLGITISKKEVEEKANQIISQYASYEDFRNKTKMNRKDLEEKIRKDLLLRKTVIKGKNIKFTKKQLKDFFDKNKSALQESKSVKLRQIFVKTKKEAEDAHIALKAGADFAKLSQLKSSDENLKKNMGDLGYIKKGILVKDIEDIVFKLKKGEFTGPIKVTGGYTILKVEDIKEPKEIKFKDVKNKIKQYLIDQAVSSSLQKYIIELRQKAKIEIK